MKGMWLLPSLNRAGQLKGFFDAYLSTDGTTPGLVLVDKNDLSIEEYKKLKYPQGWELQITDSITMGDKVREVFDTVSDLDWVGILNDDHRPRTKDWDKRVVAHITGCNVVFTNDGPAPDQRWNFPNRLCGAIAFSGKLLRDLGYMFPKNLHHFFSDDVWGILFGKAGCAQGLADVCVEHVHAYRDESLRDDTFYKINGENIMEEMKNKGQGTGGLWKQDREAFQRWLQEDAQNDSRKVVGLQPKQGMMLGFLSHNSDVACDFAMGLMDSAINLNQQNIYFEIARIEGSSLIAHARNSIVDMFLRSKCQRLLFIDTDQGFNWNHVYTLLSSNRPIVAGIVPHKRYPINMNFDPLEEDMKYFNDSANKSSEEFFKFAKERADAKGEIEVEKVGTGCMMIDRTVFDVLKEYVPEYRPFDDNRKIEPHKEFFKMGAMEDRYRGEDWFFCQIARKAKIPIYINTNTLLSHQGTHRFMIDESKRV